MLRTYLFFTYSATLGLAYVIDSTHESAHLVALAPPTSGGDTASLVNHMKHAAEEELERSGKNHPNLKQAGKALLDQLGDMPEGTTITEDALKSMAQGVQKAVEKDMGMMHNNQPQPKADLVMGTVQETLGEDATKHLQSGLHRLGKHGKMSSEDEENDGSSGITISTLSEGVKKTLGDGARRLKDAVGNLPAPPSTELFSDLVHAADRRHHA